VGPDRVSTVDPDVTALRGRRRGGGCGLDSVSRAVSRRVFSLRLVWFGIKWMVTDNTGL
jgi:hypothetical protein